MCIRTNTKTYINAHTYERQYSSLNNICFWRSPVSGKHTHAHTHIHTHTTYATAHTMRSVITDLWVEYKNFLLLFRQGQDLPGSFRSERHVLSGLSHTHTHTYTFSDAAVSSTFFAPSNVSTKAKDRIDIFGGMCVAMNDVCDLRYYAHLHSLLHSELAQLRPGVVQPPK